MVRGAGAGVAGSIEKPVGLMWSVFKALSSTAVMIWAGAGVSRSVLVLVVAPGTPLLFAITCGRHDFGLSTDRGERFFLS